MTRRPSLDGCLAKRDRAQQHLNILESAVQAFFAAHPYSISIEPDPERSRYVARLGDPLKIPETEWALIIGDCVHSMRAVLDYIAWELAGADPADKATMFPICDSEAAFKKIKWRIKRLPREVQTVIEGLQPYHGRKKGRDPHRSALWIIEMLDVSDKHKLLTLTVAQPFAAALRFEPPDTDFEIGLVQDAVFIDKAEIAEVRLARFVSDMEMEAHVTFAVAFHESLGLGKRQFVLYALRGILSEIDDVIAFFDTRFFRQ